MEIFVVRGTVGEYSERHDWPVQAHVDEATARGRAEAFGAAAREKWSHARALWDDDPDAWYAVFEEREVPEQWRVPGDPSVSGILDRTDPPTYYVEPTRLVEA